MSDMSDIAKRIAAIQGEDLRDPSVVSPEDKMIARRTDALQGAMGMVVRGLVQPWLVTEYAHLLEVYVATGKLLAMPEKKPATTKH